MTRHFTLENIKPFSINATYYGNGFVKTSAAREWAMNVFHRLGTNENELKFKELREAFDAVKNGISVSIVAYYPRKQFYTKQGTISGKIFDLSNTEKGLIDLMFLSKHAAYPSPAGCKNLQLDDKYITELISSKRPTDKDEPYIEVDISLVNLA